jgi:hypothetical protein
MMPEGGKTRLPVGANYAARFPSVTRQHIHYYVPVAASSIKRDVCQFSSTGCMPEISGGIILRGNDHCDRWK